MKEEISSLDLYYILKELQDLVNVRINRIYQENREFLITMHVAGKGKQMLRILPNTIFLTEYKNEFDEISGFCKFLRKYLAGTFIREIKQKDFERIVEITFESKERKFLMIIELFGNGNLILCDENRKIMSALESNKWKDRTIRGGIKYEYPPSQTNTLELSEREFKKLILSSKKDSIVITLAIELNFGGLYAEELCALSKIDKTKKKVDEKEIKELCSNLKKLFSKKIKAKIVEEEIIPFELKTLGKGEEFETFSKAIDEKFSKKIIESHKTSVEDRKNKELEGIKKILDQQELTIKGLGISADENQKKGEFIYEHYEEIKNILLDFNNAREKLSWKEIKEKLKEHKIVKRINEKEGQITIEL